MKVGNVDPWEGEDIGHGTSWTTLYRIGRAEASSFHHLTNLGVKVAIGVRHEIHRRPA